jgi:hypothetical protein
MFCCHPMYLSRLNHELNQGVNKKQISGLVLTRYINEPINYLYIMGSTKFESEAPSILRLVFMGVVMELQSIISNLFIISIAYFPCLRKISLDCCHTSNPGK